MPFNLAAQSPTDSTQENKLEDISKANMNEEKFSERDNGIMVDNILKFSEEKLGLELARTDIVTVHPLQKPHAKAHSLYIIKFANRGARFKMI